MNISSAVAFRIYDLKKKKKAILFNRFEEKYMFMEGLSAELFQRLLCDNCAGMEQWLTLNEITECDVTEFKEKLRQFGCYDEVTEHVYLKNNHYENALKKEYNPILKNFIEELHQNGLFYNFHIDLTYRCNEKCIHCYHPFDTYDFSKEMSTDEVKELIDKVYDIGVFYIVLSGGEALLRIELLRKYGVPFELKCVILTENIDRIENILSYFEDFTDGRPCKVDFSLCGKLDGSCEVLRYMPQEEKIRNIYFSNPERFIGERESLQRSPEQAPCHAGKYGLYCSAEGKIYPCVSFRLFLGTYKGLHEISENEELKRWRKIKIRDFSECFKHSYCNYCTEQCAGENLIENGNYLNSNVSHCVHAKIIEEWFTEYNNDKDNKEGGKAVWIN